MKRGKERGKERGKRKGEEVRVETCGRSGGCDSDAAALVQNHYLPHGPRLRLSLRLAYEVDVLRHFPTSLVAHTITDRQITDIVTYVN